MVYVITLIIVVNRLEMVENYSVLRKLRDFRDLIFDAKYNGVWVRFNSPIIFLVCLSF